MKQRSGGARVESSVRDEEKTQRGGGYRTVQIGAFFAALLVLAVVSWIPALHPKTSEAEKRDLAQFPAFSRQALLSGDYFDGINAWFADTFPFRDLYVQMNAGFRALLTPSDTVVHGEVEDGDDIPDQPIVPPEDNTSEENPPEQTDEPPVHEIEEPDMTGVPVETLGAILIAGDTAYEYYNFMQGPADTYTAAVNRAASLLDGKAQVYDMIVPTSMDITLPASVRQGVNSSDQRKAMDYMYGSMSGKVHSVDIYEMLRNHRDEYIYFRTDHHWTALGAYYAYCVFCEEKGVKPKALDEAFTQAEYPGFLGSFYNDSKKSPALAGGDIITAYVPKDTNQITITQNDGSILKWSVVTDVTTWSASAKYSSFIGGDNAWSVIENPNVTDGSACIVIKESFGNAFVPFLVPDYQTVYVVDYRYISKVKSEKLSAMVDATGAKDVLFLNNISATRNESLMNAVANFVG